MRGELLRWERMRSLFLLDQCALPRSAGVHSCTDALHADTGVRTF